MEERVVGKGSWETIITDTEIESWFEIVIRNYRGWYGVELTSETLGAMRRLVREIFLPMVDEEGDFSLIPYDRLGEDELCRKIMASRGQEHNVSNFEIFHESEIAASALVSRKHEQLELEKRRKEEEKRIEAERRAKEEDWRRKQAPPKDADTLGRIGGTDPRGWEDASGWDWFGRSSEED